jgi:hypothetical protein
VALNIEDLLFLRSLWINWTQSKLDSTDLWLGHSPQLMLHSPFPLQDSLGFLAAWRLGSKRECPKRQVSM